MQTDIDDMKRVTIEGDLLKQLRSKFGTNLETGEAYLAQHGTSETHFPVTLPEAVIFAECEQDVVNVVNWCSDNKIPLTPFGAGTSIEGNALPVKGGISLDLTRMNKILQVNESDFDCVVEPGVQREELNEFLRDKGLFFPIDPGANATLGGMASTRASGTNAVRYGTMRDAVLSLKVVTPHGKIIRTAQRARKSAAGYDLTRLYVGSEGTLGVIVEITLRLHPIPESILSAVCGFESLDGAVTTVVESMQCGVPLARVELLDAMQMHAVNLRSDLGYAEVPTLFFEFHGSDQGVSEQVDIVREIAEANGGGDFAWSKLPEERSRLWQARHQAYYAAINLRKGAIGWATDVCVPMSRLADCIQETQADLEKSPIPATILGHVGDGNFHVVFVIDPDAPDELREVEVINARMVERALRMDGTCTGEHGIGIGKQEWLEKELGSSVDQMRLIKRALDPQNLMNPGKIFSLDE